MHIQERVIENMGPCSSSSSSTAALSAVQLQPTEQIAKPLQAPPRQLVVHDVVASSSSAPPASSSSSSHLRQRANVPSRGQQDLQPQQQQQQQQQHEGHRQQQALLQQPEQKQEAPRRHNEQQRQLAPVVRIPRDEAPAPAAAAPRNEPVRRNYGDILHALVRQRQQDEQEVAANIKRRIQNWLNWAYNCIIAALVFAVFFLFVGQFWSEISAAFHVNGSDNIDSNDSTQRREKSDFIAAVLLQLDQLRSWSPAVAEAIDNPQYYASLSLFIATMIWFGIVSFRNAKRRCAAITNRLNQLRDRIQLTTTTINAEKDNLLLEIENSGEDGISSLSDVVRANNEALALVQSLSAPNNNNNPAQLLPSWNHPCNRLIILRRDERPVMYIPAVVGRFPSSHGFAASCSLAAPPPAAAPYFGPEPEYPHQGCAHCVSGELMVTNERLVFVADRFDVVRELRSINSVQVIRNNSDCAAGWKNVTNKRRANEAVGLLLVSSGCINSSSGTSHDVFELGSAADVARSVLVACVKQSCV